MSTMYEKVLEFHRVFGHPIGKKPKFIPRDRLADRRDWQNSEQNEFMDAVLVDDIVGAADALADELYFLLGLCAEMSIPIDEVFTVVHAANMRKVWREGPHAGDCEIDTTGNSRCTCGKLRYTSVGRVLKPEGWVGPEENIKKIMEGSKP